MPLALRVMLLVDSLYILATAVLAPIYAIYVEKIGGDILTAGISFAIFSFVLGILIFILGKIQDRFLKETELWVSLGYLITAFGFFSYIFVKTPIHLFLVQAVLGVGEAVQSPAYNAVYSKHLDHNHAAFQWGSWDGLRNIAVGVGAVSGGVLAKLFGFDILFLIMGTLSLSSSLIIFFSPRKLL